MGARYEFGGITEQRKAANKRLKDARSLQKDARWRGAMYLGGSAIECQLKAKLMAAYQARTIEELERKTGGKSKGLWDHNLFALLGMLREKNPSFPGTNLKFHQAFNLCGVWKSNWRYNPNDGNKADCDSFMKAIDVVQKFIDANS